MAKSKIMFIVPPFSEHSQRKGKVEINDEDLEELRVYPTLGVCYLISALDADKDIDCEIDLLDTPAENLSFEKIIERITTSKPDIICISMTTFTLNVSYNMIKECKAKLPDAKIVLGGVHINHSPQEFEHFDADYGLRGDCEFVIRDLIKEIIAKKDVSGIAGIVYKKDGKAIITPPAVVDDLDSIAFPDRTRLKPERYIYPLFNKSFTTIIGSRGCPYQCIYCGLPHNKKYKTRSTDNIMEELKLIKEQGYQYVSFSDDIFTMDRKRVVELCNKMKEADLGLTWGCATRANVVDLELLKLMKEAGCMDIRFGVESGVERVRMDIINKKIKNQQYIDAINWSKKAGLITIGFFLFGQPTETFEEMQATLKFAKKLKLDYASFGITMPIPGSELYHKSLEEGKVDTNLWKDLIFGNKELPFYTPDGVSLDDMKKLLAKANRSFYLRPGYIINQLSTIRSFSDLAFKFRMGVNFLKNRGKG